MATTKTRRPSRKKAPAAPARVLDAQGYYFDEAAADRVIEFFDRFIKHVKGRWAGQPFKLEPWQVEVTRQLFGWKRPDGTRRYRTLYLEVPRKNGKSAWASGLALYLLTADGEPSAEVYSAAADRDQAAIVFDVARAMVMGSDELAEMCQPLRRAITVEETGSTYKVLSADAHTKHGSSPHGIIFDELHTQPNRDLYDVLHTGRGARRQPLEIYITTAGFDRNSICWELHEKARKIREGITKDDTFLGVIFAAGEGDDWRSPETWRKANPNLGVTIDMQFLEDEYRHAQSSPAYENTFKRLFLNIWTSQSTRYMPMVAWDASAGAVVPAQLKGVAGYAGLDLSSTTDLTALVGVFPVGDDYKVLAHFWMPKENVSERAKQDGVPYDIWAQQGHITLTEGNVVDYRAIIVYLKETRDLGFSFKEIAYDRWGAAKVSQDLIEADFTMVPFGQGFGSMSGPTKELLTLVLAKRLHHGGNPVLRWMADNLAVKTDPAGNVKPDKEKAKQRIDGMVALIMALDRAQRKAAGGTSVFETRGPIIL